MNKSRLLLQCLVAIVALVLLFAAGTVAEGYLRAPSVVARQIQKTPLRIRLDAIPADRLRTLLQVEDPAFFTHCGVDLHTPGAGMTTITQGLVKYLYFEHFHPGLAKIRQTLLAVGFDARTPKRTQLELFLNSVYLGSVERREVLGFDDAARTYFRKEFSALSDDEFVALVAMCIGPNEYSVATHRERNAERAGRIGRLVRGECRPAGWRDVYYDACAPR